MISFIDFSVFFCHASGVAIRIIMLVGRSTTLVQTEITLTIGWIARKFCTDIHDSQMMNSSDFCATMSLTFGV